MQERSETGGEGVCSRSLDNEMASPTNGRSLKVDLWKIVMDGYGGMHL